MNTRSSLDGYESIAKKIASTVEGITGDTISFSPATKSETAALNKLNLHAQIKLFYLYFAPPQVICGDEVQLLPIDGISWYCENTDYGIHLKKLGFITIAIGYDGSPYCIDNVQCHDSGDSQVLHYGMSSSLELSSYKACRRAGVVFSNSFADFLYSFVSEQ